MYKACIFDLDGTIADTIYTIEYYGNRALKKFNLPKIDKERYKYLVGSGYKNLCKGMLCENNAFEEKLFEEIKSFYHDDYETDSMYLTKIYDGIFDVVKFLKQNGIKTGVLSNKPYGAVNDVINAFFQKNSFDVCVGSKDNIPLKPNPYMLNKMISDFNIKPCECLYVGDTDIDIKTGKSANAFTIGALWGFRTYDELNNAGADYIAKSPCEIINLINEKK